MNSDTAVHRSSRELWTQSFRARFTGRLVSARMSDIGVGTLRGAKVDGDIRRFVGMAIVLCLAALAASTIALFVAGAHRNAQVARLRQDGVPVQVTVTSCLGQLGGSGSNAAGYTCSGSFVLDGRRYDETIPGLTLRPVGTTFRALAVPGDPALMAPVSQVAVERPSDKVYVLPAVLAGLSVAGTAGTLLLLRRRSAAGGRGQPAFRSRRGLADVSRLGVADGRV